jgi:exonuclease III
MKQVTLLSWNVRGLGDKTKCNKVRLAFPSPDPSIACLQETNLEAIDSVKASSFMMDLFEEQHPLYHTKATLRYLIREAAQEQIRQVAIF